MSFDLRIVQDWEQIVDIGDEQTSPIGPFPKWECVIQHPVEFRNYTVELKRLDTHWRMRVFFKSIREGHRFMKSLFPSDYDDVEEVKFIALKHLKRYFEEQLALYNAVCIIHIGRKHTEVCDCHTSDHSQHLEDEQQPLVAYDGASFRRTATPEGAAEWYEKKDKKAKEKGIEYCNQCLGTMDIEAYLKFNMCPWCRTPLPTTQEEYDELVQKAKENIHEEWMHEKKARKGILNPLDDS